jgi:hypothetical protein
MVARMAALRRATIEGVSDEAKSLAATIFQHAFAEGEASDFNESQTWNGQLLSVTAENLSRIALPHLVSCHLLLFCEALSAAELKPFLRAVLSSVGASSSAVTAGEFTRGGVFASIISSASFYELIPLRGELLFIYSQLSFLRHI